MGLRVGQLAGAFAFALMLGRLGRLFLTGPGEPQWNLILAAAAVLGGIAWWLLGQMTSQRWIKLSLFIAAGLLLVVRINTQTSLVAGVLPTWETLAIIGDQLLTAFRVIQSGVPPVSVGPGLLAILAAAMWCLGGLFTWGSTGGPYGALFLPSLAMYLQFAVFDRTGAGLGWLAASGIALGLATVSLAMEKRGDTGRARDPDGHPLGRRSIGLAAIMAVFLVIGAVVVADNASAFVTEYGNAPWRGSLGSGYGDGTGGVRYDRLVDLRQQVLSDDNQPVFEVTVGPGAPPLGEVMFRMETLDSFDGESWRRSNTSAIPIQPGAPIATADDLYQGPDRYDFVSNVRLRGMTTDVVPTAGVPVAVLEPQGDGNRLEPTDFLSLIDAALVGRDGLRGDDTYTVRTIQPVRDADLGILATGPDGVLTPLFAAAAEAGTFPYEPEVTATTAEAPPSLDTFDDLPGDLPAGIAALARQVTFGAESDFERAWRLQSFFRDGDRFTYDANVSTGHGSLVLEEWLNDPESQNYRTGYCEQFAAAMAVMARTLDVPTRVVWGFTPGEVQVQANGEDIAVVRRRDAHAWVEVWLEPVGWRAFDPTPRAEQTDFTGQPASITAGFDPDEYLPEIATNPNPLETPETDPRLGEIEPPILDSEANPGSSSVRWWLIGLVVAIPFLAIVPLFKRLRRRRRLARVRDGDITAAWDEIVDRLTDLGVDVAPSMTPLEVARQTNDALVPLAVSYASTVYGGRTGQARENDLTGVEWWIERTYDGPARARAALSIRSLFRRD